jgi:methenyltetrahydromethanopterin cyclohydrolase
LLIFKAILKIGEISHDKRNIKNKNGVARANNLKNDDSNMAAIHVQDKIWMFGSTAWKNQYVKDESSMKRVIEAIMDKNVSSHSLYVCFRVLRLRPLCFVYSLNFNLTFEKF